MIKIIFFDIDGTLLEMGKTSMLPSTLNALEKLKQKDIDNEAQDNACYWI